jgi:hypothetical protein
MPMSSFVSPAQNPLMANRIKVMPIPRSTKGGPFD